MKTKYWIVLSSTGMILRWVDEFKHNDFNSPPSLLYGASPPTLFRSYKAARYAITKTIEYRKRVHNQDRKFNKDYHIVRIEITDKYIK